MSLRLAERKKGKKEKVLSAGSLKFTKQSPSTSQDSHTLQQPPADGTVKLRSWKTKQEAYNIHHMKTAAARAAEDSGSTDLSSPAGNSASSRSMRKRRHPGILLRFLRKERGKQSMR
jgi:hypothetical protein